MQGLQHWLQNQGFTLPDDTLYMRKTVPPYPQPEDGNTQQGRRIDELPVTIEDYPAGPDTWDPENIEKWKKSHVRLHQTRCI